MKEANMKKAFTIFVSLAVLAAAVAGCAGKGAGKNSKSPGTA